MVLFQRSLIPNLLINPLASCSSKNLDSLLLQTAYFDKSIIFPLLIFETFGFIIFVSFLRFKQYDIILQNTYNTFIPAIRNYC